eukprot:scaffold633_cov288-Ochromonas_danica.AAC.85
MSLIDASEELSFGDFDGLQAGGSVGELFLSRQQVLGEDFSSLDDGFRAGAGGGRYYVSSPPLGFGEDRLGSSHSRRSFDVERELTDAQKTIEQLRARLVRRTDVIEGIRKFYLRDVVTMKHLLRDLLSEDERRTIWKQFECALPSLDLKEGLDLHAPQKCCFQVTPCERCGGTLEIVMKDNDEAAFLKKTIRDSKEREGKWRVKLAELDARMEVVQKDKAETTKTHLEEKKVLYSELKKLREELEQARGEVVVVRQLNQRVKEENDAVKKQNSALAVAANRLAAAEKELDIAKSNLEEATEGNKGLKSSEKALQKEIAEGKAELKELSQAHAALQSQLSFLQQENKHLQSTIDRMQQTQQEVAANLEVSNRLNLDLNRRLYELEESMRQSDEVHSKTVDDLEVSLSRLRAEVKATKKKALDSAAQTKKVKKAVEQRNVLIDDLKKEIHSLRLDARDSVEEIDLLEQERKFMQDLIRSSGTSVCQSVSTLLPLLLL